MRRATRWSPQHVGCTQGNCTFSRRGKVVASYLHAMRAAALPPNIAPLRARVVVLVGLADCCQGWLLLAAATARFVWPLSMQCSNSCACMRRFFCCKTRLCWHITDAQDVHKEHHAALLCGTQHAQSTQAAKRAQPHKHAACPAHHSSAVTCAAAAGHSQCSKHCNNISLRGMPHAVLFALPNFGRAN